MTTDKQALREVAEKAGKDKWQARKINGDFFVIRHGSYEKQSGITSFQSVAEIDDKAVRDFVAMANPAAVLALLDENIQLRREKDVTEAVLSAMRDDMRQAREQLKAAEHTAAVDHEAACSLVEENEELKRKLEAENQRNTALTAKIEPMDRCIAELERSETQLINERDSAESALNDAYKAVMGHAPEWSNWFSFENAIDEIELACELWRNQTDDVIQFRQRIADLETQKADLMEHVLNAYEASALTMTLRKTVGYLPDYLRFCGIYGVEHDAIIDKLDYQSFVLARVNNEDLRQDEATCSLVAENEELKRRIAELESKNGNMRTIAHEQNGLAIRANLDSINDAVEMDGLQKRIAELEAREILLPERISMLHRTDFHEDYHTVMAYKVSDVIAAIRAAGIKGE